MFGRIFHLRFVVGQVFHVCILDEYSLGVDFTELILDVTFQCPASYRFDIIREEQTQRCEYIWEVAHEQETHNWAYNGDSHNTTAQKMVAGRSPPPCNRETRSTTCALFHYTNEAL